MVGHAQHAQRRAVNSRTDGADRAQLAKYRWHASVRVEDDEAGGRADASQVCCSDAGVTGSEVHESRDNKIGAAVENVGAAEEKHARGRRRLRMGAGRSRMR